MEHHQSLQSSTRESSSTDNSSSLNRCPSYPSQFLVRAKLEMGDPDDPEEVEADRVANDIVNEGTIRRSITSSHSEKGVSLPSQFSGMLASFHGQGSQLYGGLKDKMENGFGRDFSQVRLHTDSHAAEMSASIKAKAFTLGNDIYFGEGRFCPDTDEGQRLIAHELTHVAQSSGKVSRDPISCTSADGDMDMFDQLWNNYPSKAFSRNRNDFVSDTPACDMNFYISQNAEVNDNMDKFTDLENYLAQILFECQTYKEVEARLEKNMFNLTKGEIKDLVSFSKKYAADISGYKENYGAPDAFYNIASIVRTYLLYGQSHFLKKKRNLDNYLNGCGVRLSMAFAKSNLQIKGSKPSFWGNGYSKYDISKKFKILGGPTSFLQAIESQKGVKPIMIITITPEAYDQNIIYENDQKIAELEVEQKVIQILNNSFSGLYPGIEVTRNYTGQLKPKGLIAMKTNIWDDAQGHVTLWDGDKAVDSLDVRFLDYGKPARGKGQKYQTYYLYDITEITTAL